MQIRLSHTLFIVALAQFATQQAEAAQVKAQGPSAALHENHEQQAYRSIDSAIRRMREGKISEAEKLMLSVRSISADPIVTALWNAVFSEVKETQGDWVNAAYYASRALQDYFSAVATNRKRNSTTVWTVASRSLAMRAIRNYLLSGLVGEAYSQFDRFRIDLNREFLTASESVLLKRLADELRRVDRLSDAASVERVAFRFYPFVPKQLIETLTPDTVCRLDEEIQLMKDKRARGSLLIQRFGSRSDLFNYSQSLVGVPAYLKLSQQNPDTISGQLRNEMLDVAEWLQSTRDYPTALELTSKLMMSQIFEPPFTRERLVMVHARNLNGVHRPVEAAAFYRSLIMQYPQTEIANTARPRYVLSLHYAGQYEDVAREASTLKGIVNPKDVLWRTFWARYLSKQYSLALTSTAHESGEEQRARLQYWRGRAYELGGHKREAKEILGRIASMDGSNHYALFASWRMSPSDVQPVYLARGQVAFAAKNLVSAENSALATLRSKAKVADKFTPLVPLIEGGYADVFRAPLRRRLQSLGGSGDSLAEFLVTAGDAHAGVQFAMNQRKNLPKLPVGRQAEWKPYLAKHSATLKLLYPLPYREFIADASESFQVSPWLVLSIMRAESLFQPQVVSNVGARGLMQIMPTTGERIAELLDYPDFEPSHLDQPNVNIAFGTWYLSRLLDYYRGSLPLAIAAYNAGPEAIDRWLSRNSSMTLDEFLEDIPFDQTRKYVATVLTNMEIYSRLYSNGQSGIKVNLSLDLPTPRKELEMF